MQIVVVGKLPLGRMPEVLKNKPYSLGVRLGSLLILRHARSQRRFPRSPPAPRRQA
jgi:hypothetical protein